MSSFVKSRIWGRVGQGRSARVGEPHHGDNGYARAEVNTERGCTKLGIDNLKSGIITRGVLIDIPRLKNQPYLEPGTAVYVEDLEAWEKKAGVRISSGDAIFLRTGRWGPAGEGRTVEHCPERSGGSRVRGAVDQSAGCRVRGSCRYGRKSSIDGSSC